MSKDQQNKIHSQTDPIRWVALLVSLILLVRLIIGHPVATSPAINLAAYFIVCVSYLIVMLSTGAFIMFALGKLKGVKDYNPSIPVEYVIVLFSIIMGLISSVGLHFLLERLLS